MTLCRLCRKERPLRNSHIVPEFLYEPLYNEKHQILGIRPDHPKGKEILQKGIRDRLFCEACEQFFNEHFEKPFRKEWVEDSPIPSVWGSDQLIFVKVNYASFKLFHLSILFRAGVCQLPTFSDVQLGPHEERLRSLLLNIDPGKEHEYPIVGYAVVHDQTRRIVPAITRMQGAKLDGRRCYGAMYGGVQWWIYVSSSTDSAGDFKGVSLKSDGTIPIAAVSWQDLPIFKQASDVLRSRAGA